MTYIITEYERPKYTTNAIYPHEITFRVKWTKSDDVSRNTIENFIEGNRLLRKAIVEAQNWLKLSGINYMYDTPKTSYQKFYFKTKTDALHFKLSVRY